MLQRVRSRNLNWHFTLLVSILLPLIVVTGAPDDGALAMKDTPQKGDTKCPSLADRYDEYKKGADTSAWLYPCQETPFSAAYPEEVPANGIVLEFFASLPAFSPDFEFIFTWAIIGYLNESSIDYDVEFDNSVFDAFNYTDPRRRRFEARVVHQKTISEIIDKTDIESWWWHYHLIFYCFWEDVDATKSGQELIDDAKLRKIKQDLNRYLRNGVQMVNSVFQFHELSRGLLGLAVEDPFKSTTPFIDGPATQPPSSTPSYTPTEVPTTSPRVIATYAIPIDAQLWDWRRYVGLSIFLGTFAGALLLTQMAAYMQRRRTKKELWGNLGTEEGVDALLTTGWKVKGSKMEVYDKEGWGYRDDDSIFMGGYEQSAYVGAEITVTHDSKSVTTP